MKRIILILVLVTVCCTLQGFFSDFSENPAQISDRESGDIILPLFSLSGGITNNHLFLSDFAMFEEDHVLTDSEKKKLTAKDFNLQGYGTFNLLSFGYRNWELSFNSNIKGSFGNIDKEFLEIIFKGNDIDKHYKTSLMSDTYAYQFMRGNFTWGYPGSLNLSSIPMLTIATKDSNGFITALENTVNYLRETDIYLGASVSWYNSLGYAEVVDSRQEFVTTADSLYASSKIKLIYSDYDSVSTSGNNSFGFGLGMKIALPNGWFHFSIDDIGARLKYSDLLYTESSDYYRDFMEYLDEEYEAENESEIIEDEIYDGDREINISSSVSIGAEYNVGRGFGVMAKYLKCHYLIDGFFLGTTYRGLEWLPVKLTYGNGEVDTCNLKFGFETNSFEILFGLTNYNGLFNAACGYGGDFGIKFKF
jgi:hypothetical protein